jgi:hypothetical protein
MLSMSDEASVWRDRAEQARETADLLTDPMHAKPYYESPKPLSAWLALPLILLPSKEEN